MTLQYLDLLVLNSKNTPQDVALYLRQASDRHSIGDVNACLLQAIEQEIVAPEIFCLWMSAVRHIHIVLGGITQRFSLHIRRLAIKSFGRMLRTKSWKEAWNSIGGTPGMLKLMEHFSSDEVGYMCEAIGKSGNLRPNRNESQREMVTELARALFPLAYPDSVYKTKDERPLSHHYVLLVPSCSSNFVIEVLQNMGRPFGNYPSLPLARITQYHWPMLRTRILAVIRDEPTAKRRKTGSIEDVYISSFHLALLLSTIPQLPTQEKGLSSSMSFSFSVLQSLANDKDANLDSFPVASGLVDPLIRRLKRNGASKARNREAIDLIMTYLQRKPKEVGGNYQAWSKFLRLLLRCWCDDPDMFEGKLISFLKMYDLGRGPRFEQFDKFIFEVPQAKRYDLLRLMLLHLKGLGYDIETEQGLKNTTLGGWPKKLITALPPPDAVALLERLIQVRPDCDFLEPTVRHFRDKSSILSLRLEENSGYSDPKILLVLVGHHEKRIMELAKEAIDQNKEKAARSRDPGTRAWHAKAASFYAIATRSLQLYEDVVLWSRRFVRDPQCRRDLFVSYATLESDEGIQLLAGGLSDYSGIASAEVRARVEKGNQIIMHFLEFALNALREQSFSKSDWAPALRLFRDVPLARMKHARQLRKVMSISIEDLDHILWSPTLDMLIKAETIGLQQGHEALELNTGRGSLDYGCSYMASPIHLKPNTLCRSVYRFLDDLARRRDALWREFRPTVQPAAAVLGDPWPKGLPIQHFSYIKASGKDFSNEDSPFLCQRAKDAVFLKKDVLITDANPGEDAREAISTFVDRWQAALKIYVEHDSSFGDPEQRARAALEHALQLSQDRMNRREGLRFWSFIFKQVLPTFVLPQYTELEAEDIQNLNLQLPSEPELDGRDEWNPYTTNGSKQKSHVLPVTALDCMLHAPEYSTWGDTKEMVIPGVETLQKATFDFWHQAQHRLGKFGYPAHEAIITAALLFLDSRIPGPPSIYNTPFPDVSQPRLPAVFLDQDFLDQTKDDKEQRALDILETSLRRVPPRLLSDLTAAALTALSNMADDSPGLSSLQHLAYNLLHLLSECENPEFACNGVLSVVVNHPDASSWHRFLLSKSFLRRLPAQAANVLLQDFARAVSVKLGEQVRQMKQRGRSQEHKDEQSAAKPVIKVTTIKFLAQLFGSVDAIPTANVVDVLAQLFKQASHLDVRVAIVNGLTSKLEQYQDADSAGLREKILSALEMAVPVMGQLTERHPISEHEWIECESGGDLPEIYGDGMIHSLQPIQGAISRTFSSSQSINSTTRLAILDRIILPSIERSRHNNQRWVSLFLKRYVPECPAHTLVALPVKPFILSDVVRTRPDSAPFKVLQLQQQYILCNLNPPEQVRTFLESMRIDYGFRSSTAGKHFLYLFGRGTSVISDPLMAHWLIADRLSVELPVSSRIVPEHLTNFLLEQASTLLFHPYPPDPNFSAWDSFIGALRPFMARHLYDWQIEMWPEHVRPLLLRIIALIASIRDDPKWTSAAPLTRQPLYLPDDYILHLRSQFQIPAFAPKGHSLETCRIYAAQIIHEIRLLVGTGLPAHSKLATLKSEVQEFAGTQEDRLRIATLIGDVWGHEKGGNSTTTVPIMKLPQNTVSQQQQQEEKLEESDHDNSDNDDDDKSAMDIDTNNTHLTITTTPQSHPETILRAEFASDLLLLGNKVNRHILSDYKANVEFMIGRWIGNQEIEELRLLGFKMAKVFEIEFTGEHPFRKG